MELLDQPLSWAYMTFKETTFWKDQKPLPPLGKPPQFSMSRDSQLNLIWGGGALQGKH